MQDYPNPRTTFSPADIQALKPEMKIGLLCTINPSGEPHLTLISTIRANTPTQVIWGQFTEGQSKQFIQDKSKSAFLVMNFEKELWRGKANFTHSAKAGPEYEAYNNVPMFRYNAYFGVHTVFFMDLIAQTGKQNLPMASIIRSAIQTILIKQFSSKNSRPEVLSLWTRRLMNKMDNLKFLAYIGPDGYPIIIPIIQAQSVGTDKIIFSSDVFQDELFKIPPDSRVAIFGMSLDMTDVLMRGTLRHQHPAGLFGYCCVQIDWVYNPMPPKPQQIYPLPSLKAVTRFE